MKFKFPENSDLAWYSNQFIGNLVSNFIKQPIINGENGKLRLQDVIIPDI